MKIKVKPQSRSESPGKRPIFLQKSMFQLKKKNLQTDALSFVASNHKTKKTAEPFWGEKGQILIRLWITLTFGPC